MNRLMEEAHVAITENSEAPRDAPGDMEMVAPDDSENVHSIQIDQGEREEMAPSHMRQTPTNWDIWILTKTWRENKSEVMDFQAEEESDEDDKYKKMATTPKKTQKIPTKKKSNPVRAPGACGDNTVCLRVAAKKRVV